MKKLLPALGATACLALSAAQAEDLSIATGGTGGTYYPLGGGLAELIGEHIDGASAVAEVTGASVENMGLVHRQDSDLAIALADTVYAAYEGGSDSFNGQALDVAALASLYPNAVQIVTLADSGIESLSDLRGQRVSVGAPGSGTEVNAQVLLESNGISYDDFTPERLNFNETADALRDGDIDAGIWSVGPPTSSILSLASARDIRIISLSEEEIANAREAEPVFAPYELRAGLYEGVDTPTQTVGIPNVLVVNTAMSEDLAYQITKLLFEEVEALRDVHPAANDTTVDFALESTPIPMHPGALRYYDEIDADVPDRLRP